MTSLFGYGQFSVQELRKRVGNLSQIAGIRPYQFFTGRAAGVKALEFYTGSGLHYSVLVDRSMDIYEASFKGVPLAWLSPVGVVSPSFYEPEGSGWLRSWGGGLMTTCGLEQAGTSNEDQGMQLGLHGRIGNLPAENLQISEYEEDNNYLLNIRGIISQQFYTLESYRLTREITSQMGKSTILVKDTIENVGFSEIPLQFLYHINLGFPLIDEKTRLLFPSSKVTARDEVAEKGISEWDQLCLPIKDYSEQVFEHEMNANSTGYITIGVINDKLNGGIGLYLRYLKDQFPFFAQWKQMGEGWYALGLEPGNCHPHGRHKQRQRGTLTTIAPGEKRHFEIEFGVLEGREEIQKFEKIFGSFKADKFT